MGGEIGTMHRRSMIIICGPTGVGKSDFAEQLAEQASGEIINMDLGQFYTPLSIGTAKPDWRNAKVTHHLFDILDSPTNFTVVQYRELLLKTSNQLWDRNILPIVVGGSAFYLKSLLFPPVSDNAHISSSFSEVFTWNDLYEIDPERANALHENDHYRINRAVQIWRTTGTKPSLYQPKFELPCNVIILFLTRERKELYARINERVDVMIKAGWLDEVKGLYHTPWEAFLYEKKLIGYNELLAYCAAPPNEQNLERTIAIIQQRTRHYAKRQETFWRGLERALKAAYKEVKEPQYTMATDTANLTLLDVNLYIKQLLDRLKNR